MDDQSFRQEVITRLVRIETKQDVVADHEPRLRALEASNNNQTGSRSSLVTMAAAAASVLAAAVATVPAILRGTS